MSQKAAAAFAGLPLTFVENRGQVDGRVRFHAQGAGHAIYLTRDEIALTLRKDSGKGVALALRFLGADPRVVPSGTGARPAPSTSSRATTRSLAHGRARLPRRRVPRPVARDRHAAARGARGS